MEDTQKKLFQTHVNQRTISIFWTLWESGFVVAAVVVVVVVVVFLLLLVSAVGVCLCVCFAVFFCVFFLGGLFVCLCMRACE